MPERAVGLLGGTFDPIHLGHLRIAEEVAEALGINAVRILPTGTPPHRRAPGAPAEARLAMTRLAIAGNPRFVLDEHEIHKTEPCYMVDTLEALRRELGPAQPLVLIVGGDAFLGLDSWHDWRRLLDFAHIAVAHRPGYETARGSAELRAELQARKTDQAQDLQTAPAGRIYLLAVTQLDISASDIRARRHTGRSLRYLVPESVHDFILQHRLYS